MPPRPARAAPRADRRRGSRPVLGHHRRTDGAEVELVVAERGGRVPQRVIGADDSGPFGQVGGERPLEHIARVDQQDGAAVAGARAAQVGEVAAEGGKRLDPSVQIVGADERDRHAGRRCGSPSASTERRHAGSPVRPSLPAPGRTRAATRLRGFPNGRSSSIGSAPREPPCSSPSPRGGRATGRRRRRRARTPRPGPRTDRRRRTSGAPRWVSPARGSSPA